ncbi:glycogen phosphorylase [hydrocarbon metagenome]|uniref:Glycogen phosphorylase n=1 Tax=hydrocarbon metagenome TaxID=938273 RepID=A0A0W8FVT0_9ZZZZ
MVKFIGTFNVAPSLPKKLSALIDIAYNLYWTWNQDAVELFRRLDRELWDSLNHNPVMLLGKVSQERLLEVANDDGFMAHLARVDSDLKSYLNENTWYQKNYKKEKEPYIAYFSAEFGLTECLQIYSGGLGVLSGDHLKSASDLGIPLIGIGLGYREGYFQQYLSSDGWQQERYEMTDFYNQPLTLVTNKDGATLKIELQFPGRKVYLQVWKIQVGRVPLFLLDTYVPENNDEDKNITRSLYGGNIETRIQQEIILGIGGIRALHAMNISPLVCHMNEGHSAFLALERIRTLIHKYNLTFEQAKDINLYSNVFTTHTPVPAGIDVFSGELVEKYFGEYYRKELGISDKQFYSLGTIIKHKEPANFNMAHLAMNTAGFVNGVSKLHGLVSKKMWVAGFTDIPFDEIPIDYVTNGIHTLSHLSYDMNELFYRYLGNKFISDPADADVWKQIDEIPDEELWRTHERRRERLIAFARKRLKKQVIDRGGSDSEIRAASEVLNASALTIGFARRFATYKRATLIFKDIERLSGIICNSNRPVQFIIAGKAHPRDEEGKELIQEIIDLTKDDLLRKRIVFLENYDMNVARYMVEGCDIWLNNPRRPLEASGTSGMKVIANGGLNFSVLDGWWDEGYSNEVGWKIGNGEEYDDLDYQDELESRMIYDTLEKEIVPRFYERGDDKLPRGWITMMKASMKMLGPVYNTNRMVAQYVSKFYVNSFERRNVLMKDDCKAGKDLSAWKSIVNSKWDKIKFNKIEHEKDSSDIKVGGKFIVTAEVDLGELTPNDVEVQIYFGKLVANGNTQNNSYAIMNHISKSKTNLHSYQGEVTCKDTGQFGYTLRILPKHKLLINPFELGLIKWAN